MSYVAVRHSPISITSGKLLFSLIAANCVLLGACTLPSSPGHSERAGLEIRNGEGQTLLVGEPLQLEALVRDPLPRRPDLRLVWTSSHPEVVQVTRSGLLHPKRTGEAVVTAEYVGLQASIALQVSSSSDAVITSLDIEPSVVSLVLGESFEFRAIARGPSGQPVGSPGFTWSSSDPSVADVSDGRVTAHKTGQATIAVAAGSLTTTATVTVSTSDPASPTRNQQRRAFPAAQGYGARALVGCNRTNVQVLRVTTTASSGSGSLSHALDRIDNERLTVVLFDVGGTINGGVTLAKGCVYIAGQTAPGDGVQIVGTNGTAALTLDRFDGSSDVVIRYLRTRSTKGEGGRQDVIAVNGGRRIVLDHLSAQFGNDEVVGLEPVATNGVSISDVTISNTIIAAGLMPHSTGSLFMSPKSNTSLTLSRVSMYGNLWAHSSHRNPSMGGLIEGELVNNIVYNWKGNVGRMDRGTTVDIVGNAFLAGPWTKANGRETRFFHHDTLGVLSSVFVTGNVARPAQPSADGDQRVFVKYLAGGGTLPGTAYSSSRLARPEVRISEASANTMISTVLDHVGASGSLTCDGSWTPLRDRLDLRIVSDVQDSTGPSSDSEIDHPNDLGGIPTLVGGTPCADSDGDGMPDAFEVRYGLEDDSADASGDPDGDAYTNIEEYLNGTDPRDRD